MDEVSAFITEVCIQSRRRMSSLACHLKFGSSLVVVSFSAGLLQFNRSIIGTLGSISMFEQF